MAQYWTVTPAARGHEATIIAVRANWLALQLREPAMEHCTTTIREPRNKGKLVGQKAPLKLKEIWAIRVRLQLANRRRELALFNLAIDSACDLLKMRVRRGQKRPSTIWVRLPRYRTF